MKTHVGRHLNLSMLLALLTISLLVPSLALPGGREEKGIGTIESDQEEDAEGKYIGLLSLHTNATNDKQVKSNMGNFGEASFLDDWSFASDLYKQTNEFAENISTSLLAIAKGILDFTKIILYLLFAIAIFCMIFKLTQMVYYCRNGCCCFSSDDAPATTATRGLIIDNR